MFIKIVNKVFHLDQMLLVTTYKLLAEFLLDNWPLVLAEVVEVR